MKNILLIDDQPRSTDLLASMLEAIPSSGLTIKIHIVSDLVKAWPYCAKADLLVINLEVPGAFEFLNLAKAASIPVIVTIPDSLEAKLAARFIQHDFLVRPYERWQVNEVVSKYIGLPTTTLRTFGVSMDEYPIAMLN